MGKPPKPSPAATPVGRPKRPFTRTQGQYLAFIYYYTKVMGQPPAEAEIAQRFGVTPPAAHGAIMTLLKRGLIAKTPGVGRSIRVLLPREQLPDLE